MKLPFVKYQGAGNDFILLDGRYQTLEFDFKDLARQLCQRQLGVGADGLLLLLPSTVADYRMRILNADGSEPAMCGNGLRCLADFLFKRELRAELTVETSHGVLKCRKAGNEIAINLGCPTLLHWPISMEEGIAFILNTGVPHAVFFVEDLSAIDVQTLGCKIRNDSRFAPYGVNVNFARLNSEGKVSLRTYERGVEAETLACGTGAAATAYVAQEHFQLAAPIVTLTRSSFEGLLHYREHLRFQFPKNLHGLTEIEMLGTATEVFEGNFNLILPKR